MLSIGEQFFINDYVSTIKSIKKLDVLEGISLGDEDVAAEAIIEVMVKNHVYTLNPVFIIKDKMIGNIPVVNEEIGARVSFMNIRPQEGKFELSIQTTQKDYIIMKAIEMPFINILWLGTIVLMMGFSVAIYRRYQEFKKSS